VLNALVDGVEVERGLQLGAVVGLDDLDRERERGGDVVQELDRYTMLATNIALISSRTSTYATVRTPASGTGLALRRRPAGLDHFPSRSFAINQAWLTVVMLAVDLIAWTQHLLHDFEPQSLTRTELPTPGDVISG
jgi:hypothetical protein